VAYWSGRAHPGAAWRAGPKWTLPQCIIGRSHRQLDLIFGIFDKTRTIQKVSRSCKSDTSIIRRDVSSAHELMHYWVGVATLAQITPTGLTVELHPTRRWFSNSASMRPVGRVEVVFSSLRRSTCAPG
jgi:hypothetical protein